MSLKKQDKDLLTTVKLQLHNFFERLVPEKRIFLRTGSETRFVRLSPITQIIVMSGSILFIGWAAIATAIVLLDTVGSGNFRDQARRDQGIYEERLNALAAERDNRTKEALSAQQRFNTALAQVSTMQSELLESEDQRKELERGIDVVQATLRRAMNQREELQLELDTIVSEIDPENGVPAKNSFGRGNAPIIDYINDTLASVSLERDKAGQ